MDFPSPVVLLTNTLAVGGAERYVVTVANWIARHGGRAVVVAWPGVLAESLEPAVRFVAAPHRDVRAGLPLAVRHLRRVLAEERPAAVVANTVAGTWTSRLAAPRLPVVTVAHGWPAGRYRAVGPLLRAANRVVAVSPDVRDRLLAARLPASRCVVVENGVDLTGLAPLDPEARRAVRAGLGLPEDALVAFNAGRLVAQKAHETLIEVAARLREAHPRLFFVVAGDGERRAALEARAAEAGVADRVRFLGERRDIPRLLGTADLYLSTSTWEGMPLATIEAMGSALPVVATRTEGAGRLLDADSGFVREVGDAAGLAEAVGRLAADPDLRRRMGEAAARRARAHFGHDRMVRELLAVVAEAVRA